MDAKNILTHICNSIVMFIDLMIIAHPIYLLHVLFPILFGIIYTIFSLIYQLSGGLNLWVVDECVLNCLNFNPFNFFREEKPYIYSIMDWTEPKKAIIIFFGVTLLATGIHCILWIVCRMRIKVFKLCNQKNKVSFKDSPLDGNDNLAYSTTDIYKKLQIP